MLGTRSKSQLRIAEPGDAVALVALQREIYREGSWFVGDGPPAAESLARRLRSLDPDETLYIVAACGEEICGWLELHRLPPKRLRHVAVLTLAVGPVWRRQGIGRQLLQRAWTWAARHNVRKVSLHVRAGSHAAIALYQAEGFVLEGREREQIRTESGFEDNLVMAKFLEDGRA